MYQEREASLTERSHRNRNRIKMSPEAKRKTLSSKGNSSSCGIRRQRGKPSGWTGINLQQAMHVSLKSDEQTRAEGKESFCNNLFWRGFRQQRGKQGEEQVSVCVDLESNERSRERNRNRFALSNIFWRGFRQQRGKQGEEQDSVCVDLESNERSRERNGNQRATTSDPCVFRQRRTQQGEEQESMCSNKQPVWIDSNEQNGETNRNQCAATGNPCG